VTRHTVGSPASSDALPLRLVQLSDLHIRDVTRFHERIAEAVEEVEPDVIVLTGDSVDSSDGLPALRAFLSLLPPEPKRFATLGNWEHWGRIDLSHLRRLFDAASCQLLVNRSARLTHQGSTAELIGVDDLVGGTPDLAKATTEYTGGRNAVILSHCPEYRDRAVELRSMELAAMLSGHTHGGQIALGGWAPYRPQGSGRYRAGWYMGQPVDLYVSRGLGTSILPVRLGSVPEIAVFDWFLSPT